MPASAYYKISAKDETKAGIRSALNGLNGLKTGASSALSGIAKIAGGVGAALAAIGVAGLGISGLRESVAEFQNAAAANIRLAQAVRNNPFIDGSGFTRLKQYADQLQKLTVYDADQIKDQVSLLAGMQLSEAQIRATLDAATNLAASGLMPLDTAIQSLGRTWSGNLGTMGRIIPSLKNLTTEQLRNGEAVKAIAQNYAGMAAAMAKTEGGIYAQFQNRFGDLKEAIGKPLSAIGVHLLDAISPGIEKATTFLENNSHKIVNFFVKLPDIAMKALSMIPAIYETVFSLDFVKAFFQGIWNYYTQFLPTLGKGLWEAFKGWFKAVGSLIVAVSAGLWVPIREKFKDILDGIKVFFAGVINFLIEKVNDFLAGFTNIAKWDPIKKVLDALKIEVKPIKIELIDTEKIAREIKARKAEPVDMDALIEKERDKFYGSALDGLNQALGAFGDIFAELGDTMSPTMKLIAAKLEPIKAEIAALINATEENTDATEDLDIASGTNGTGASNATPSWISTLLNKIGFGMEGGNFTQLTGGNIMAGLSSVLQPLTAYLGQLAGPVAILALIFKGMLEILMPAIETVIGPLINALMFIGELVGRLFLPILEALSPIISVIAGLLISFIEPLIEQLIPVIEFLAQLISLFLVPIIKGLAIVFEILSAPIRWVGDLFVWFGDVIRVMGHNIQEYFDHFWDPWNRDNWAVEAFSSDAFTGLADRIQAIWEAGGADVTTGSWDDFETLLHEGLDTIPTNYDPASGSGANYAAAGDIYLTIANYGVIAGNAGIDAFTDMLIARLEERNYYARA